MLHVILGIKKDCIHYVSDYFDAVYDETWLNNKLAKDIILGIDKSTHIKDNYIESPVLGAISPRDLSSGCKGVLLLLNEPSLVVCGERFGDNCFEWLFKVAEINEITITLSHFLRIQLNFTMHVINSNKIVHNTEELNNEILECREKGLVVDDYN